MVKGSKGYEWSIDVSSATIAVMRIATCEAKNAAKEDGENSTVKTIDKKAAPHSQKYLIKRFKRK